MRVFVLILSIIVGLVCIKYSFQIVKITGHMEWAENKLGAASTYTIWKLIGIAIIVLGVLYAFGVLEF